MAVSDSSNFIVTLVHGTFAQDAQWVQPESILSRALQAQFGDAVVIEPMPWSGCNSFTARRQAAQMLRDHMLAKRDGLEGAKHVVIAHSHAGNIVLYAARDPAVKDKLAATVTLAAPFIVARRRNLGWSGKVLPMVLLLWLTLGLLYLIDSLWVSAWMPGPRLLLFVAVTALVMWLGMPLARHWVESSEAFLEQLGHAEILKERLLVLRAVADEATGSITFLQFPSLATTFIIGRLAKITDRYVSWCERLVEHPIRALGFCFVAFSAVISCGLFVAHFVPHLTEPRSLFLAIWGSFACLSFLPIVFLLFGNQYLALVMASGFIGLPVAPIVLILAITSMAFGFRFAIANINLDVSVEATPIGQYEVTLLSPSCAGDLDMPGSLLHSALYEDEHAIKLICDFIATRIA